MGYYADMTIPTPPAHQNEQQYRTAEEAILQGKLLSYIPGSGWAHRSMDEISGTPEVNEKI